MKTSRIIATIVFLLGISLHAQVGAEDAPPAKPYSGDLLTRSTLSGDWWGLRNDLADKGVTLDMSLTQVTQGIVHGGKVNGWQYSGGNGDMVLNVDTGKLGLWPGGFLNVQAEGNFIPADNFFKSINGRTGALMPVNTNAVVPLPGDNFNLPALNFTQFLSEYFGLTLGKFATVTSTSGDMNEFAHGLGDTQFMNMALNFNPVIAATVPYSTLGTGVIVLPTKDPKQAIVSLLVLSATGSASTSGFNDLDGNNITVAGEGRVRTDFFGLTGHQLFGATFANKKYTSINQDARIIIENDGTFAAKKGSWNVHYNFDQYLYEPKKGSGEGVGVFGRFGASDGNPNFMQYFYSLGLGGKGVIPNRQNDRYGLGFYYIDVNRPELQGIFRSTKLLRDEYGFEAFYNVALTPWLMVTPDIQIVRGAQKDTITLGNMGPIPVIANKKSIGTATILGLRLQMVF
jgi:porin